MAKKSSTGKGQEESRWRSAAAHPAVVLLGLTLGCISIFVSIFTVHKRGEVSAIAGTWLSSALLLLVGTVLVVRWVASRQDVAGAWEDAAVPVACMMGLEAILWPLALNALFVSPPALAILFALLIAVFIGGLAFEMLDRSYRAPEGKPRGPFPALARPTIAFLLLVLLCSFAVPAPAMGSPFRIELRAKTEGEATSARYEDNADGSAAQKSKVKGTTASPTIPCSVGPGEGVNDDIVAKAMEGASHEGSAPSLGCLAPAQAMGSAFLQDYSGDAVLIGSRAGAGVVSGPTLRQLRQLGGGAVTPDAIGGQVLNRFHCGTGAQAEMQPLVSRGGVVVAIASRAAFYRPDGQVVEPVLTPSALLPELNGALEQHGPAAATGAPSVSGGHWIQWFVSLESGQPFVLKAPATLAFVDPGIVRPSLTAASLFTLCNPGAPLPAALAGS